VRAGLEVHQQLATGKLFCDCPSELFEESLGTFVRYLRPTSGESRAVDAAASFQAGRGLRYRYEVSPASCLVDLDEEPPHPVNPTALDVALSLALLLDARPVDEIVVMRKIVVDGSNTAGFQRTALVATDGHLEVGGKRFSILSVCLEEDAARKVDEGDGEVRYRLDRLGIPLVEIATGPDITSGAEARAVAEELGALVRATRRVRRGIGTIREDLNVSEEGGRRVEIKGVQELRKIPDYVDREVGRQRVLLAARDALRRRSAPSPELDFVEVTESLAHVPHGPLSPSSRKGGPVLALRLRGFAGLLKSPPGSDERLGRELADRARAAGVRGLLHSDELPAYGVEADDVAKLRQALGLGSDDAFVLVTDPERARAEAALHRVAERAEDALEGVPAETRDPLPDGRTRYSRPLPGRERMYPETDIAPIPVRAEHLERLQARLPERPGELRERLARETGVPREIVVQLVAAGRVEEFEGLFSRGHAAPLVARLLIQDVPAVPHDEATPPHDFPLSVLDEVLKAAEKGEFAKEGIPNVLTEIANGAPTVASAIARAGFAQFSSDELDGIVERVVAANVALVRERGDAAFQPLMGDVMREVRGRRDGQEVAAALRRAIARRRTDAIG
jgi:glutamyl-tRNA(Gln) amidotransferase subunit E